MTTTSEALGLQSNNIAFVFDSDVGVIAADLGLFLQRASTVSRQAGVDLYVVGLREGSLAVVAKVVQKGIQAGINEFKSSPIRTSASATALASIAYAAISAAANPSTGIATPLAKAGAALVEHHSITQISLITQNHTTIVMDSKRAAEVRALTQVKPHISSPSPDVRRLISSAQSGELSGTVVFAEDKLYFRPDGFRYLVPIDRYNSTTPSCIAPGNHVIIFGEIVLRDSRPDTLVVRDARLY